MISRADWEELQALEACDCIEGAETGGEHHEPHCAVLAECVEGREAESGSDNPAGPVAELRGAAALSFTDSDGHVWTVYGRSEILPTYYEVERDDGLKSWRAAGLIFPLLGVDPSGEER